MAPSAAAQSHSLGEMDTSADTAPDAPRTSWRSSLRRAALIEGVLLALTAFLLSAPGGADGSIGLILAALLQFPASLLFDPAARLLPGSLVGPAAVIVLVQFAIIFGVCEYDRRRYA